MKSKEILRRYALGERDFRGVSLKGQSFKGKVLSQSDFSRADIRGANFAHADLREAKFGKATAGLTSWAMPSLVIVLFLLSGFSGYAAGIDSVIAIHELLKVDAGVGAIMVSLALIALFISFILGGFIESLIAVVSAIAGSAIIFGIIYGITQGQDGLTEVRDAALWTAGVGSWSLAGIWGATITVVLANFIPIQFRNLIIFINLLLATIGIALAMFLWDGAHRESPLATILTIVLAVAVAWLGVYTGLRTVAEEIKLLSLKQIINRVMAKGGTTFQEANLTDADFTEATLKATDFKNADITRTNWRSTKNLDLAGVIGTILLQAEVRDLVVKGVARKNNKENKELYTVYDLRGANLKDANLRGINLKQADISDATFQNANLEGANLTKVQAIGTDFTGSSLTGACLQGWNIDFTTKLDEVNCTSVYLLEPNGERYPITGEFKAGEFSMLFKEVLNTVDLFFRENIDWNIISDAISKVRESENAEITIHSVEKKDGIVVVKVGVPSQKEKEAIHYKLYQAIEEIERSLQAIHQRQLESLERDTAKYRQMWEKEREHNRKISQSFKHLISKDRNSAIVLIVLSFNRGSYKEGFSVKASLVRFNPSDYSRSVISSSCRLPPCPSLTKAYKASRIDSNESLNSNNERSITPKLNSGSKNVSSDLMADDLDAWLMSADFSINIANELRKNCNPSDEIRIIIESDNYDIWKTPWHSWEFVKSYKNAEISLSLSSYKTIRSQKKVREIIRILVVVGDTRGIDVSKDVEIINNLSTIREGIEIETIKNINREELSELLNDEVGWDIFCFLGHSGLNDKNIPIININERDEVHTKELEEPFSRAIEKGLKMAIFNSCYSLGIARELAKLNIPTLIAMRAKISDPVAQEFLEKFLSAFAKSGKSLYVSVREAREKLQALNNRYSDATWLPIICQNPADFIIYWEDLKAK